MEPLDATTWPTRYRHVFQFRDSDILGWELCCGRPWIHMKRHEKTPHWGDELMNLDHSKMPTKLAKLDSRVPPTSGHCSWGTLPRFVASWMRRNSSLSGDRCISLTKHFRLETLEQSFQGLALAIAACILQWYTSCISVSLYYGLYNLYIHVSFTYHSCIIHVSFHPQLSRFPWFPWNKSHWWHWHWWIWSLGSRSWTSRIQLEKDGTKTDAGKKN